MTYENWCLHSTAILAEAEAHNNWAEEAKEKLLTDIGPRLAKLNKSGYMGCGFHYSLEQDFGKLFGLLAICWQPSANWCKNVEDDRDKAMIARVIYKCLLDSVKKAEKSVPKFREVCGR
jgi:hypothetical protein